MDVYSKPIAECVGLWLAEGDKRTRAEITFTNNEVGLISLFDKVLRELFPEIVPRIRIYCYSKRPSKINLDIQAKYKYYTDIRATKTYYIWRVSGVEILCEWKQIVTSYLNSTKQHKNILRGFFAGEGNIKINKKSGVRIIRIAQLKSLIVELLLHSTFLTWKYNARNRSYIICGRDNWERASSMQLAQLHPDKRHKFDEAHKSYKEYHLTKGLLKDMVIASLHVPITSRELAKVHQKTEYRIRDVLQELKREGKVQTYRCISTNYWVLSKSNVIVISQVKHIILKTLHTEMRTSEIARILDREDRTTFKRLKELEFLRLVKQDTLGRWSKENVKKKIIVK